ncbi:MAG TPA: von Willebrand factor type A domain-containing protein, partial [Isosphaeraceae bacterium]|nr:von Willebrand factor type A domain-containing protein [Isosphaeraceae bacterium]
MTFDPNDPRLTAYVLGELDPSEHESVENLLKESDEARQAVEEIRLMVGWLTRELHREQETYAQQPALNHQPLAGSFAKPSPARRSWWSRNAFKLGALAALLLLTVGLVRVAITPRGEPAASAPNLVAAAKARGVAGEFDAEERILAETPPVASELAAKPAVLMTAAPRPAQAAPAAPAPLGLARDSLGLQPVRRWSVVKASAAVELAFYVPGASPAQTLALNAATGKDAYATQDVKDQPLRESEAIQYRQPNQANQVQGLGGGAAMMNNRGSLPNRQPVSGSHAAKVMAPAQSLGRSDLSQRGGQVPKASMAPAGAAVASNDRSPRSMSPQRAPERLTEGASETSMAGATPAAAANQVEKLEDPSQISGQAHSILESKAKSTFAFEVPQPATPTDGPFRLVRHMPRSTFPIDVDTSSYATIRRDLTEDRLPPKDTVRIEELLNELPYHDAAPSPVSPDPFALHVEIAGCPWDQRLRLARVGITARPIDQANRPPCNLVFLIDVSSSMRQADRLPLVQWSLEKLTDQLGARDRLAIVTFGQTAGLVLASTSGMAKSKIRAAVDDLRVEVQDGTRSGLALAYELAGRSFIEQGTNRVILVTDASARIGAMGRDDLIGSRKTSNRVSLSVIGVGG